MNQYLSTLTELSTSPVSKYVKWYVSICQAGLDRASNKKEAKKLLGYVEGHHILPKCMCPSLVEIKDPINIVYLTAREHFIAHRLLSKIFKTSKMYYTVARFQNSIRGNRKLTSRQLELARRANAIACGMSMKGNQHSLGKNTGPCSNQRRDAIKTARLKTKKQKCPHCGKKIDPGNYKQYHGDNCKNNPNIDPVVLLSRSEKAKKNVKNQKEAGTWGNVQDRIRSKGQDPHAHNNIMHACPHCGKIGKGPTMKRHHFDRCPHKHSYIHLQTY